MAGKVSEILDKIKSLNQVEVLELEQLLRTEFNVTESEMMGSFGGSAAKSETTFDLLLTGLGSLGKIEAIKALNATLNMSISEAKEVISNLPYTILAGATKDDAESKRRGINDVASGMEFDLVEG